jgi:hypothetical protein
VLPGPVVADDPLQGPLEVAGDGGVGMLLNDDAGGRVGDVDENGRGLARARERGAHLVRDVHRLGLALREDLDLEHGRYRTAPMTAAPVGSGTLGAYREEADRFLSALDEEFYLHFAGLKPELDLGPIYERFTDLTALESCRMLEAAASDGGRGATELWRFACEGYFGALTREETEAVAQLEASLAAEVDGKTIPFRMLRPALANEHDRATRERLERARVELAEEHLAPRHVRVTELLHEGASQVTGTSYRELYERFGFALDDLGAKCEGLLATTEDAFVRSFDGLLRARLGLGLEEAERWDVPRLFRASDWDAGFPADAMVPALAGTLADLGIDLAGQENVELDLEPRPNKSPRAFCAPIQIPERVVLVIQPIGGPDDWHALFHEAGHTEHYAHTSRELSLEERRLGDNAVTEGWAALFEFLVDDPAWLSRRLSFGRPGDFAAETAATYLYLVRRYAAKLLYELELHRGGALEGMCDRYVELMYDATKIEPASADFLADVDPGFYASSYLRSWAFEAQMQQFLREEFGTAWFARREAGSLLRELWSEGQRLSADELLHELTGAEAELDAVIDRAHERLRA